MAHGQSVQKAIGQAIDMEARSAMGRALDNFLARSAISWAIYEHRRGKFFDFASLLHPRAKLTHKIAAAAPPPPRRRLPRQRRQRFRLGGGTEKKKSKFF
jgi:hypothetical protein